MFYLVPSEGAMLAWFAGAIEAGRDSVVPPEWFDRIQVFDDADSIVHIQCLDCQRMIQVKDSPPFTYVTLREVIVAATRHRQEQHDGS